MAHWLNGVGWRGGPNSSGREVETETNFEMKSQEWIKLLMFETQFSDETERWESNWMILVSVQPDPAVCADHWHRPDEFLHAAGLWGEGEGCL